MRAVNHVLEKHIECRDAPYYCSLCGYKGSRRKDVETHTRHFARHQTMLEKMPAEMRKPDNEYIRGDGDNRYDLLIGRMSQDDSAAYYRERRRVLRERINEKDLLEQAMQDSGISKESVKSEDGRKRRREAEPKLIPLSTIGRPEDPRPKKQRGERRDLLEIEYRPESPELGEEPSIELGSDGIIAVNQRDPLGLEGPYDPLAVEDPYIPAPISSTVLAETYVPTPIVQPEVAMPAEAMPAETPVSAENPAPPTEDLMSVIKGLQTSVNVQANTSYLILQSNLDMINAMNKLTAELSKFTSSLQNLNQRATPQVHQWTLDDYLRDDGMNDMQEVYTLLNEEESVADQECELEMREEKVEEQTETDKERMVERECVLDSVWTMLEECVDAVCKKSEEEQESEETEEEFDFYQ